MRILIEHIKAVENLSLYIDATGGVVKRPSNMKGKIFYYALVLSGAGKAGVGKLRPAEAKSAAREPDFFLNGMRPANKK